MSNTLTRPTLQRILAGENSIELLIAFAAELGVPLIQPKLANPKTAKHFVMSNGTTDRATLLREIAAASEIYHDQKGQIEGEVCVALEKIVEGFRKVGKEHLPALQDKMKELNDRMQAAADDYNDTMEAIAVKSNNAVHLKEVEVAQKKSGDNGESSAEHPRRNNEASSSATGCPMEEDIENEEVEEGEER